MYKCLTGENPPDAIERVMDDNLKEISEFGIPVSKQMEETIIKGMSISARNRYQNIEEFCEDLYALSEETLTLEEEESKVEETLIEEDMKTFSQEAEEEKKYVLHNPKIENDPFVKSGKKVIWDCLWFGKYPQKQITQEDGAIYSVLKNEINWDLNNDVLEIIYVFLTIFLYLLKCPQSLILSALRAFCFCGKPHISRSIFLYFRYQAWLKSW